MQTQTVTERGGPPVGGSSRMTLRIPLGGDAPTEVRLFRFGENETTKGTFTFDTESAASVMAADADYGNERSADYEHQALYDPPIEAPASAWYRLELREDGLYAVDIRWTERAKRMIEAGEYRYISPAFSYDPESGRIMSIINFALTNLPATKRMEALLRADPLSDFVAANYNTLVDAGLMYNGPMSTQQKLAMDALHSGARLYAEAFPMETYEDAKKDKDYYMSSTVADDQDDADYAALHITPEDEPVTEDEPALTDDEDSGSSPLQGADSSRTTPAPTPKEDGYMETIETILSALGLANDATPEQIHGAVAALRTPAKAEPKADPLEPVRAALGMDTGNARVVTEKIAALKAEVVALNEQVEKYREVVDQQTVDVIMAEAREAGKVTPATEKLYLQVFTDEAGRVDIERLKTLVAGLPKLGQLTTTHKEPAKVKADYTGKTWAEMNPQEKRDLADADWDLYQTLRAEHNSKN